MKKTLITLILSQFALTSIYAMPSRDMMFADKPIDSLCFDFQEKTNTIDLQNCGAKNRHLEIVKDQNDVLSKKGFIGYSWRDHSTPISQGFSYYKFYPAKNNHYWVYTINNGGGSGEFTDILLAKRKDENTLEIQTIASGDRCNGGIQDVVSKNHELTFSVNLTSYDLISLANNKLSSIKPYDDLAACAVCCVAKAFYTTKDTQLKFIHVTLNTTNVNELPEQGKYATCFNKLLAAQNKILSQAKIKAFVTKFNRTCIQDNYIRK